MRRRFKLALLAIPTVTLLTHASVGLWQSNHISKLRDQIDIVVLQTLKLESQIGYGGMVHNFKNAVLRSDEPDYIQAARQDGEQALATLDRLETLAQTLGLVIHFPETRNIIEAYSNNLDEIEAGVEAGLTPVEIDELVRVDDTLAVQEIKNFQADVIEQINDSIDFTQMILLLAGVLISMIALAGGYFIVSMSQAEQKRINERRRIADMRLIDQVNLHNSDLLRVNTSLQQFAGIAAHDLTAPSRQIISFSELAIEENTNQEQRQFYLQAIRQSAEKMRRLIETLLDFARKGFQNPKRDQVNMASLLREIVNEVGRDVDTPIDIQFGELPYAFVDPQLMERVFTNLIENAVRYGRPDVRPKIKIDGWRRQGRTYFAIEDNGIGVDTQYADLIFEPFKRIKADLTDGNGIGLSLVKSIIESHGGRIRLDTEFKDGARFEFWLPERLEALKEQAA